MEGGQSKVTEHLPVDSIANSPEKVISSQSQRSRENPILSCANTILCFRFGRLRDWARAQTVALVRQIILGTRSSQPIREVGSYESSKIVWIVLSRMP
jgi:hypothetical protein